MKKPEKIITKTIKPFGGGSAHVIIPRKFLGRLSRILIYPEGEK